MRPKLKSHETFTRYDTFYSETNVSMNFIVFTSGKMFLNIVMLHFMHNGLSYESLHFATDARCGGATRDLVQLKHVDLVGFLRCCHCLGIG